ncbi:glycosyltransferase family 2 protein [Leeuwenhoekiella sp. CH_XMU1409-2]|uniref:glycosyltransferase family 2 protein n=1 Tax=Leeuwenhoekiella sp. CH_XMU1409-2 TaxID=3107768 RepID=UPI00300970FD
MTVALIIATYNWPQALELIFLSVLNQRRFPDEVIIADDGSRSATKSIIENFEMVFPNKVNHVWQEDLGFRKSKILNKALKATSCDYIIQIDGDCILHPQFIRDHIKFSETNTFLYGSRVNIQKNKVETLFASKQVRFSSFSKGIKKRTRALHIPLLSVRYKALPSLSSKIRGCNFSYWRKDALAIKGYDEFYTGWGREDSDFAARLLHNGIMGKRIRYAGIVYHIWHSEESKDKVNQNTDYFNQVLDEKRIYPKEGI